MAHPDHFDGDDHAEPPAYFLKLVAASANTRITSSASITTEGEFRIIKSNGWPDHTPGTFPRKGNPNVPTPQSYSFRMPLKPKVAAAPERRGGWWWGVAINGVPFEPGTAEAWNNDRRSGWSYEAATGFLNLGLDEHNAHVQPNGSYHYHALPTGIVERLGGDGKRMLLIGWAADGFPIYSGWAYSDPKDPKSGLRRMTSSYHLRQGARPQQVGGPGGNYDGRFTQDFEYKPGSGDLDECNGRTGVTPEFPQGTYYYCIIPEFPFVPRLWHGTPDPSFSKGEGPPGGGPRLAPTGGAPRGIMEGPSGGTQQTGRIPASPIITSVDRNKDGVLDADEVQKSPAALKSLDRNGDGKLTPEEYRPAFPDSGPSGAAPPPAPTPAPPATSSNPPTTKPNILMLLADDLGWGDVGFHGGKVPTPSIERLTKEGSELQRFYVHPVCSPTRAALLSGQMPRRFGVTDVMGPRQTIPEGLATLPATLRTSGYTTSLVGKWHLGKGTSTPMSFGFEHFYGFLGPEIDYFKHTDQRGSVDWQRDGTTINEEGYSTDLIASEAIRQITNHDSMKPFYLQVAFNAPHVPQSAPNELIAKYKNLGTQATGAAVIDAMDAAIGRILIALDQQKLQNDTLVVFFSDNGSSRNLGSNGSFRSGKGTLYEGGIHTTCAIRWPGQIPAGKPSLQPTAVQDLFPTLVAAAGATTTAKLDGVNLWPALHEGRVDKRPPLAIANGDIALIDGDWKLIEWSTGEHALYNLGTDPSESKDEFATRKEIATRLSDQLATLKKNLPPANAARRPGPGAAGRPVRQ